MDVGRILLELLVVLTAARVAAEVSERIGQPAVLGEILLGIVIGPSALGIAGRADSLRLLGEIGVILLLFEVGRQMDLAELLRVGGASMRVATIGVVVPMALGFVAMRAAGIEGTGALFLAAGITATSVGITARVFGDLRALATAEARTVLGAAVADDVIGLIILTVVVRTSTGEGLDALTLTGTIAVAVAFVVAATIIGSIVAPRLIDGISARARTEGTVMALGLVVALGFARLAEAAQLAPIVGAFVAGLAVGRSRVADDLHRRLTPLGHFFIPIFFLQIGIDTKLRTFADAGVLGIAGLLAVVAVAGKLVSGLGAGRAGGNKMLVGVGMIPRGEVGLIFASIGLSRGVLDARTYAVLLLVVLVSTLVTPPWLRRRIERARRGAFERQAEVIEPPGGWLRIDDREVELGADPPPVLAGALGLDAAIACATRRPGNRLSEWVSAAAQAPIDWDDTLRASFFQLLEEGNERSWRFLEVSGLLPQLLPQLENALRRRPRDAFDLDPFGGVRWNVLEDLKSVVLQDAAAAAVWKTYQRKDLVMLAALVRSVLEGAHDAGALARTTALSVGLGEEDADEVAFFVDARHLLPAASARHDMGTEEQILDLAAFVEDRSRADGLYLLAVAENAMEPWERDRLDELYGMVVDALSHPDLTGRSAQDLFEQRQAIVAERLGDRPHEEIAGYIAMAPRRYVLSQDADTIVRHLQMIEPPLGSGEVRLQVEHVDDDRYRVHIAVLDRPGLLAAIAGAFAACRVSVEAAQIATWRGGIALDVFDVTTSAPDAETLRRTIEEHLDGADGGDVPPVVVEGHVTFDNLASPWHTIIEVQALDRSGLLYRVASALTRAGVDVHQATVSTRDGVAVDTFWVTGRNGAKLDAAGERAVRDSFAGRSPSRWRARLSLGKPR